MPELLSPDALERNAPKVVPPLAGFWHRFGALLIDLIILNIAFRITFPLLRSFYLSIGSTATAFGLLAIFAYFFLAEGPVGKGVTVGKAFLRIRTADSNGEPPGATAAAIRAALLLVWALPLFRPVHELLRSAVPDLTGFFVAQLIANSFVSAYVIANVFLVVLDPLKQSLHDLLAQTVVVREGGAHFLAELKQRVEEEGTPLRRRARQIALLAFILLAVLFSFRDYQRIASKETREFYQTSKAAIERLRYREFNVGLNMADLGLIERTIIQDGFSSDSIQALYGSGGLESEPSSETDVLVISYQSNRRIGSVDLGTTAQLAAVKARAVEWAEQSIAEGTFPLSRKERTRLIPGRRAGEADRERVFQPESLALLFIEQVNMLAPFFPDPLVPVQGASRIVHVDLAPLEIAEGFYEKEVETKTSQPTRGSEPATTGTVTTTGTATGADEVTTAPAPSAL